MISIIICSSKEILSQDLAQNIKDTIESLYELIVINNYESKYSIFEAYNLGIQKSKGEILCFIHDDILFHTQGWGVILESEFEKNNDFDLIGVAGTKVKTQFPTGWWDCESVYKVINIIQHEKGKIQNQCYGFVNNNLHEVLVIDGVFMALKQKSNFLFDANLTGYHNYDLNLSCKIKANGGRIGVTNKILIEHLSIGKLNKDWFFSIMLFHKKYSKNLRENCSTLSQEIFAGKRYIDNTLFILGKKEGLIHVFSIFRFSTSIRINLTLGKYIISRYLRK